MPTEDVSDLKDVVDAINRLCDTMKTSSYDEVSEDCSVERLAYVECESELVSPEEVLVHSVEVYRAERWSDCRSSFANVEDVELVTSDPEQALVPCEPTSEMYYTASSEVSLASEVDIPERVQDLDKDEKKECVIAGHVAAMRERFESMTRTNTPCPDLLRSSSPSLEVFRYVTPSPDHLE